MPPPKAVDWGRFRPARPLVGLSIPGIPRPEKSVFERSLTRQFPRLYCAPSRSQSVARKHRKNGLLEKVYRRVDEQRNVAILAAPSPPTLRKEANPGSPSASGVV